MPPISSADAPTTIFMFSGQGSHYYQMGRDLFEQRGAFYRHALELNELIRQDLGVSILAEIYDPQRKASDRFDATPPTHCAIFLVEYALGRALIEEGIQPDFLLTASMGSFAALALAHCLTVEEVVSAVVSQARLLDEFGAPGGIVAVPNLPWEQVRTLAARFDCDLGAINNLSACTLSAERQRLGAVVAALRESNAIYQQLAVSRAFHSRWIDAARAPFLNSMTFTRWHAPSIPIVCCADVDVLHEIRGSYLWDVVRQPIRFDDTVRMLAGRQRRALRFIDVGPSGTLATSLKFSETRLPVPCEVHGVLSPFGGNVLRYARTAGLFGKAARGVSPAV